MKAGAITIIDDFSILLVKSRNDKWIFPKGEIKKKEQPFEAAQREAYEEGGVMGDVELEPFCTKNEIPFYILKVNEILDEYPESINKKNGRERKILQFEEALQLNGIAEYTLEIIKEYIKEKLM